MTEKEWLASKNLPAMVRFLGARGSERKHRLFMCACCRRIKHLFSQPGMDAVGIAEQFADGGATRADLSRAATWLGGLRWFASIANSDQWRNPELRDVNILLLPLLQFEQVIAFIRAVSFIRKIGVSSLESWIWSRIHHAHAQLFRDIFPFPLRPIPLDPGWLTSTVQSLAETAYQDRDFDILPILADALEDAGCTDADILNHCRGPGPHVRGCWVVDLLLGRE